MTALRKLALGVRMFLNTVRIRNGTSYKTHLAMALKILETPPEVVGDVIECGTWKGGSAANLSLVCRIVGRRLKIFDSFEGLPAGESGDREAHHYRSGDYCGTLEEVRRNIRRYGAIESCEFLSIIGGGICWTRRVVKGANRRVSNMSLSCVAVECQE